MKVKNYNTFNMRPIAQPFSSLLSAFSMEEAIRELMEQVEPIAGEQSLFDLENRLALLNLMASAAVDDRPVYLWIRGFPGGRVCYPAEGIGTNTLQVGPRNSASNSACTSPSRRRTSSACSS